MGQKFDDLEAGAEDSIDHIIPEESIEFDRQDNRPGADLKTESNRLVKTWFGEACAPNRKFDDKAASRYLGFYARTGRKADAAHYAGVSYMTIRRWELADETFGQCCMEAHEVYLSHLEREAHRRAVEGWLEPVVAGKDPQIVTYVRKFSDRLLELLMKKADPSGYGNREAVTVNVNTGVLHAPMPTDEGTTSLPIEEVEDAEVIEEIRP